MKKKLSNLSDQERQKRTDQLKAKIKPDNENKLSLGGVFSNKKER